jgi:restriction system protein
MDEMDVRRIGEFLRIVFVRLWQEPNGLPAGDVLAYIPQATTLTEEEKAEIPGTHTPMYERTIRLATTPYVKAGWIVKSRGRWFLTDEGKRACKNFPTAQAFSQEAGRLYAEWRQNRSIQALVTEQAGEMAWEQIHGYLQEMQPYEFQSLVGELISAMGYHIKWAAPPEKQRGYVNFVIHSDPLGLAKPTIKVHLSHRGQPVVYEGLKAFMSFLGPEEAGIYVSSGGFTSTVMEAAQEKGPDRIILMDLERFITLWVENYDNLSIAARQRLPLKAIHFLSPMD